MFATDLAPSFSIAIHDGALSNWEVLKTLQDNKPKRSTRTPQVAANTPLKPIEKHHEWVHGKVRLRYDVRQLSSISETDTLP